MNTVEKAHSAAVLLGRMGKAVTDFHDKMKSHHEDHMAKTNAMHKVHHDDMKESINQLHGMLGTSAAEKAAINKILGVEEAETYGDGKPKPQDIEEDGTESLIHIPGKAKAKGKEEEEVEKKKDEELDKKKEDKMEDVAKTIARLEATLETAKASNYSAGTIERLETAILMAKASVPPTPPEPEKPMTKADVTEAVAEVFKALFKGEDDEEKCPTCGKPIDKCSCKAAKAAPVGLGVRSEVVNRPVVTTPVTKAQDGGGTAEVIAQNEKVDIQKAVGGDPTEALKFMRGVKATPIPNTLADAVAKIH